MGTARFAVHLNLAKGTLTRLRMQGRRIRFLSGTLCLVLIPVMIGTFIINRLLGIGQEGRVEYEHEILFWD